MMRGDGLMHKWSADNWDIHQLVNPKSIVIIIVELGLTVPEKRVCFGDIGMVLSQRTVWNLN